uniref:Uncharacterized protein n=1 Tax=Wuchereria bancrofti TaxID=6293 RepID=A0AAF5Q0X4_WUCBA
MKNFNTFGYFTKTNKCSSGGVCYCLSTIMLEWDNMHLAV